MNELLSTKLILIFIGFGVVSIIACAFYASLLPPHLCQEFDALNYHITLPRQHLLMGSFSHIAWSTADLYLLPIDFALAPFWLATELPNKIPQFFFILGLLAVSGRLAWRFSGGKIWPPILAILAILGSHNIGIQVGTAMLDVTICYLFIAAIDCFLNKTIWLAVVELSFYIWSKPLMPVQFIIVISIFCLILFFLHILGIRKKVWVTVDEKKEYLTSNIRNAVIKATSIFVVSTLFIAGPFILKSLYYSGTPIFPLGVGVFRTLGIHQSPERLAELKFKAAELIAMKDSYGSGRSFFDFIQHLWLVAVPEKGVNNRYDYPIGLMYLLFIGPFIFLFISQLRKKILPLLPLGVIVFWGIWWLGCQQTRYLYVPIILMYLSVTPLIYIPSRIFLGSMLAAILLVSMSVYRANRQDFGHWGKAVLREKDKELVELGRGNINKNIKLPFYDVAHSVFPVESIEGNDSSIFVIKTAIK